MKKKIRMITYLVSKEVKDIVLRTIFVRKYDANIIIEIYSIHFLTFPVTAFFFFLLISQTAAQQTTQKNIIFPIIVSNR